VATKLVGNNSEKGDLKDAFFCEHVIEIEQENIRGQQTMSKEVIHLHVYLNKA